MMLSKRKNIWLFWKLSLQWSNKKLFFHCPLTHFEAVHKWRHPLMEEGGSAKSQRFSISLFSKMGDKGEGGVKNLKKRVTSFMDNPLYTPQNSDLLWICVYKISTYLCVISHRTYILILHISTISMSLEQGTQKNGGHFIFTFSFYFHAWNRL